MASLSFRLVKKGVRVKALLAGGDHVFKPHPQNPLIQVPCAEFFFRESPTYEPLDASRVFAVDTESLPTTRNAEGTAEGLRTELMTLRWPDADEAFEPPEGKGSLERLCARLVERYGVAAGHPSDTRQRPRMHRRGSSRTRDGRRANVPVCLGVFFNMAYDLGRICSDRPEVLRSVCAGADSYTVHVSRRYSIEVARMHLGSSASFEWYVRDHEGKRIARVLGLDLTGYWKTSLNEAAKAAGVTPKREIPADWYKRPRSEFTADEWGLFREYGLGDVRTTLELYHATVGLLCGIDARVVRRTGVIPPSAPGAAARIVFQLAFDMHPELRKESGGPGKWSRAPQWADQYGCSAYYGGRVFCVRPGRHERMASFDCKSAYAYAMASLPDPVTAVYESVAACSGFDVERFRGQFGVLQIDGCGLDDVYPALRVHDVSERKDGTKHYGRLRYLVGQFKRHHATIPEIVLGVLSGTLRVDRIHGGVIVRGSPEKSFLRAGMAKFFGIKNDATQPKDLRDMAKLLGNSTYGKLIECNAHEYTLAEHVPVPVFEQTTKVAKTFARLYASGGGELEASDYLGDTLEQSRKVQAVYKRLSTERDATASEAAGQAVLDYVEALTAAGAKREVDRVGRPTERMQPLGEFMRGQTTYRCGQYFMPLYAANVTGLMSAILGAGARCTKALQGDTDSLHVPVPEGMTLRKGATARELKLPGWAEFDALLARGGYGAPIEGLPGLGQFFCETDVASVESVLVRPKVYSHDYGEDIKQAKHGVTRWAAGKNALHVALGELLDRGETTYHSKAAPRKLREAVRTDALVGEFISHDVTLKLAANPHTHVDGSGVVHWRPVYERPPPRWVLLAEIPVADVRAA